MPGPPTISWLSRIAPHRLDSYWSLVSWYGLALAVSWAILVASPSWLPHRTIGWIIGMVWTAWFTVGAAHLANALRHKGYEWARWWNCIGLQIQFARRARQLPPHDEVASLPDFTDSARGLAEFLSRQFPHPRANADSSRSNGKE